MFHAFESLAESFPARRPARPSPHLGAFLWASTDGLRPWLAALVCLRALTGMFEAALFAMLGQAVEWPADLAQGSLWARHGSEMLWFASMVAASPVLVGLQTLVKHQTLSAHLPMRLRWNFHRLSLEQGLGFYQDEFAGRVASKMMQTAQAVRDGWMTLVDLVVFIVVYLCTMLAVVGSFDAWLLLPFAAWLLAYAAVVRYFVPRLDMAATAEAHARSSTVGCLADTYLHIKTVKLFPQDACTTDPARAAMGRFLGATQQQMRLVSRFEFLNQVLNAWLILSVAALSFWLWDQNRVGTGAVAASIAMALRLTGMSHWLMWEAAALFEDIGTMRDGLGMLAQPPAVQDRPGAGALRVTHGEVCFHKVSFGYGDGAKVIEHMDLRVRPGERVGLVGLSGAGKSTLLSLLLRLHDVQAGTITVDGQDIAQVTQESLRRQIGVVAQDAALLHRSVRDNLLYGRPDASEAQLHAALRQTEAHAFIETLRDAEGRQGLDAHLGECGAKISGGQRQRIAIARVLLKDAPILFLDEATSALDAQTEAALQDGLHRLMQGKTVLAIAHRLSTIAAMDRLVVLDQGRIVEEGSHQCLLARGGLYARLWARQSGASLADAGIEKISEQIP